MIVIIGAGGFLASAFINKVCEYSDEKIVALCRCKNEVISQDNVSVFNCDITDKTALNNIGNTFNNESYNILCLAASHNIDFVEQNPEIAHLINVDGTLNVFNAFPRFKRFFFTSTDAVYGEGKGVLFTENDTPDPISEYGRQKLEAERIVLERGGTVLRLPYMYGKSLSEYKKHFTDDIIHKLSNGEKVRLFTDYIRSALTYERTAELIFNLFFVKSALPGIINLASDELTSKYDIGLKIAMEEGLDSSLIIPETSDSASIPFNNRVKNGGMSNSLLKEILDLNVI